MKTHILFDNDGVLVDTEPLYFEATRNQLRSLGLEIEVDVYLAYMARGESMWRLAEQQGFDATQVNARRAARNAEYRRLLVERDIDIQGVRATLDQLSRDYRMAIVTTSRRTDFELIHRERRLVRLMDFVLANGDYPRSKPEPDGYLAALARFGISAESAVVIEDSERGLRAALAAGIDCVVVANHFTRRHDFTGARAQISKLGELPELLERWNAGLP